MSLIAWLIVLQFLLIAGFIVSTVLFFIGIILGFRSRRPKVIVKTEQPTAAVNSAAERPDRWRIADTSPETITG